MKYYQSSTSLSQTWEETMMAFWQRYPNPFSKHVLSEDTVFREIRGPILMSRRLLMKTTARLPGWARALSRGAAGQTPIVEDSILDRENRTLVTWSRNVGCHTRFMKVAEKCVYSWTKEGTADSNLAGKVQVSREAWITSQVPGISSWVERFGYDRSVTQCDRLRESLLL